MIQRIQSVYLLFATLVTGTLFFIPIAEFIGIEGQIYVLKFQGLFVEAQDGMSFINKVIPLSLLISITTLLSLVTIFFYKRRILQIRLTTFNILLLIGLTILMAYYLYYPVVPVEIESKNPTYSIVLPLVSVVLSFMALKGIRKDEEIIKSYNRIR